MKTLEWWEVENTGWTNGQSWFAVSANSHDNRRFDSHTDALQYITDNRWDDDTKWRTVHVTLERTQNQTVTTRTWTEV